MTVASDSVKTRRDVRARTATILVLVIIALGGAAHWLNRPPVPLAEPVATHANPHPPGFSGLKADPEFMSDAAQQDRREVTPGEGDASDQQVRTILRQAREEISKARYDMAIATLTAQQPVLKDRAEAYLLVARALEGRRDFDLARDFYNAATSRDPYLADAYWGFATTSEQLGDLEAAIGGMRNYLHLAGGDDPYRLRVAQARSALWEWEAKLGRGPWGPTKGVPPGFSEAEIRRDGRGVGIKMQAGESIGQAGETPADMKHQDNFKIFTR